MMLTTMRSAFLRSSRLLLPLLGAAAAAPLVAQCANQWLPGTGINGVAQTIPGSGQVESACEWDPDGAGPQPPVFVVGGLFGLAGNTLATNVATWSPATGQWAVLGAGLPDNVQGLDVLPGGALVAGGPFGVRQWNGLTWQPVGNLTGFFWDLCVTTSGTLVAAMGLEVFAYTGGAWTSIGDTALSGNVQVLVSMPNGDLVAGGTFSSIGGVAANRIARWDGVAWHALGNGVGNHLSHGVTELFVLPGGDLLAGGTFSVANGAPGNCIARWDGASWSALGAGFASQCTAISCLANGDPVAVDYGGLGAVRWDGSAWVSMGLAGSHTATVLQRSNSGHLLAGDVELVDRVRVWDGTQWLIPGVGVSSTVSCLLALPDGSVVAGGSFLAAGGVATNRIGRWDGATWSALGGGLPDQVHDVVRLPSGDLVAATAAPGLSRWDGSTWSTFAGGTNGTVRCLAVLPNGDLVAGGEFTTAGGVAANRVARWDGSSWHALGSGVGGSVPGVRAVLPLPNGDLLVGGSFTSAGGLPASRIARWDGSAWHALGSGVNQTVHCLALTASGSVVVGGAFSSAGGAAAQRIATWDGVAWGTLGSGVTSGASVQTLLPLPSGDLIVGGDFVSVGGVTTRAVARWNGAGWSAIGSGTGHGVVHDLAVRTNGEVVAGGTFLMLGGEISSRFAQLASTCPAQADSFGSGCVGSGGANVLVADTLPWTGTTLQTTAHGMPGFGLVLTMTGFFAGAVPLQIVFAEAGPGCSLLTTPDIWDFRVPTAGTVTWQYAIPNNPSLAFAIAHQQFVVFEFDAALAVELVTSTNGLTFTIGVQ